MKHKRRVDIVLPVLREEELFKAYYTTVVKYVRSDWRLLVVYDQSTDPTVSMARMTAKKDPRVVLIANHEGGLAAAIKIGIASSQAGAVLVSVVDLLDDIKKLDYMLSLFYSGGYAIVAPSRYMSGGSRNCGKIVYSILSRLAGISLYHLAGLPIHDATNASKLYRKSFLDSITIESTTGWTIGLEITAKAHRAGERVTEIPIDQQERLGGKSKFKLFKILPQFLYWYWFAIKNK